jgi:hypothetical protein
VNNKKVGTAWEYEFFARILDLGYDLFIPAGDNLPQDCIVGNSAGKLFKVQIKGTTRAYPDKRNTPRYKICAGSGAKSKTPIDCTKVDLLAVYIASRDVWYLIPCLELTETVGCWFYPDNEDSKARFEIYRDNWSYFKQG